MPTEGRDAWDNAAASFDDEPDHGLTDPDVRSAWAALILPLLPSAPARVVGLGCGTGSVAALLTAAGHEVVGVDFSLAMLARASAKAGRRSPRGERAAGQFRPVAADVEALPLRDRAFDVVIVRHVVWALRRPDSTLGRWVCLLRPGGVLLLVEGRWSTGDGLRALGAGRARPPSPPRGRRDVVERRRTVGQADHGRAVPHRQSRVSRWRGFQHPHGGRGRRDLGRERRTTRARTLVVLGRADRT